MHACVELHNTNIIHARNTSQCYKLFVVHGDKNLRRIYYEVFDFKIAFLKKEPPLRCCHLSVGLRNFKSISC